MEIRENHGDGSRTESWDTKHAFKIRPTCHSDFGCFVPRKMETSNPLCHAVWSCQARSTRQDHSGSLQKNANQKSTPVGSRWNHYPKGHERSRASCRIRIQRSYETRRVRPSGSPRGVVSYQSRESENDEEWAQERRIIGSIMPVSRRYRGRPRRRNLTLGAQPASEGRKLSWMRVQGETSKVSPCAIFGHEKPRDGAIPPLGEWITRLLSSRS
jgi:hypothetical protein